MERSPLNPLEGDAINGKSLEMEQLLKLRLVVARFGEGGLANWWNTKGQLGKIGSAAVRRGFPRTHHFAQARAVFAVAAHRCAQVYDPPDGVTLWRLPEAIEFEFDTRWEQWLDKAADWAPFFAKLETIPGTDLTSTLRGFELVNTEDIDACSALRPTAEGRALLFPGTFSGSASDYARLALGFSHGRPQSPAVPYMLSQAE